MTKVPIASLLRGQESWSNEEIPVCTGMAKREGYSFVRGWVKAGHSEPKAKDPYYTGH